MLIGPCIKYGVHFSCVHIICVLLFVTYAGCMLLVSFEAVFGRNCHEA